MDIDTITADATSDIERLARYRLERDLSFTGLAAEMTAAGYPVKARTLHLTLTRGTELPRERTRFKIREFIIARLDQPDRRPRKSRKSRKLS